MDSNIEIKVNTKCEILVDKKTYKSNIQDVEEDTLAISIPVYKGNYAMLQKDEKIEVIFYDSSNVYGFESKVVGKKIDGIAMIKIEKPDFIKKIQRRRFFRMELFSKVKFKKVEENLNAAELNKAIDEEKDFNTCIMVDLSGGGMKIKTEDKIKEGELLLLKIPIKSETINLLSYCVRVTKEKETNLNVCGLSFYDIDDVRRDRIISYLFELMRKLREKQ